MITISIDALPPSVNHYYGRRGNITFLTERGKKFRELVVWSSMGKRGRVSKDVRLSVSMAFVFKNKRRSDIDNRVKPLWDALVKASVIPDDKQIDVSFCKRFYGDEERTVVKIREV